MKTYHHAIRISLMLLLLSALITSCSFRGYDPPNYNACSGTIGIIQGK